MSGQVDPSMWKGGRVSVDVIDDGTMIGLAAGRRERGEAAESSRAFCTYQSPFRCPRLTDPMYRRVLAASHAASSKTGTGVGTLVQPPPWGMGETSGAETWSASSPLLSRPPPSGVEYRTHPPCCFSAGRGKAGKTDKVRDSPASE